MGVTLRACTDLTRLDSTQVSSSRLVWSLSGGGGGGGGSGALTVRGSYALAVGRHGVTTSDISLPGRGSMMTLSSASLDLRGRDERSIKEKRTFQRACCGLRANLFRGGKKGGGWWWWLAG